MNTFANYILSNLVFAFFINITYGMEKKKDEVVVGTSNVSHIQIKEHVLREVALKCIEKYQAFDTINDKLRKFHSDDAKGVWSNYNKATLPKAEESTYSTTIQKGNLATVIRKDILSLVGKSDNTFYTALEINSVEAEVKEAVLKGVVVVNPRNENTILITYDINRKFGELCKKNDSQPFNVNCQEKHSITIVIVADEYFNDIVVNGNESWKTKNLVSKIFSVY